MSAYVQQRAKPRKYHPSPTFALDWDGKHYFIISPQGEVMGEATNLKTGMEIITAMQQAKRIVEYRETLFELAQKFQEISRLVMKLVGF